MAWTCLMCDKERLGSDDAVIFYPCQNVTAGVMKLFHVYRQQDPLINMLAFCSNRCLIAYVMDKLTDAVVESQPPT